jgi:cell division protein FtsZ
MNEACSLIAEAADPDANIIFGSVIDPHAGDEVRITVIATGFQTRDSVQPGSNAGMGRSMVGARGRDNQMALPMQRTEYAQAPAYAQPAPVAATSPVPPWAQPTGVATRGYAVAPGAAAEEAVGFEEFYENVEQIPGAPGSTTREPTAPGGFGIATAAEWTPAERPVIRPPVTNVPPGNGPASNAPARRMSSQMAQRPADELGVEESEFDKPTYLRRGIFAPE